MTRSKRRVGEVAGGTAAECAAVCCCCPCSVLNLMFLAVYKVPRGLCRKAWAHMKSNKKNKKRRKSHLLPRPTSTVFNDDGLDLRKTTVSGGEEDDEEMKKEDDVDDDDVDAAFEKEMWDRFYGAGFWRNATSASS